MEQAYKLAAIAVKQRFTEQYPEYLNILSKITKQDVAVYSGDFDQAEQVLNCLGIPATINPNPKKLSAQVIFINCSREYNQDLVQDIGSYVEQGKWLVSSDWALDKVIEKAFPNLVRWNGKSTGEEIASVEPFQNSLWSDIVVLGADPQWWLWGSHPIEVLNPDKVKIEAASHDLLVRYNAPVVAVRFDWGKGHVFHVISHFWAKRSETPTVHHKKPCIEFLRSGMKLSEVGIEKVLEKARINIDEINFAQLQSAATSTELVAQLCVSAVSKLARTYAKKPGFS
jgi:hydrogenase maturation factor